MTPKSAEKVDNEFQSGRKKKAKSTEKRAPPREARAFNYPQTDIRPSRGPSRLSVGFEKLLDFLPSGNSKNESKAEEDSKRNLQIFSPILLNGY